MYARSIWSETQPMAVREPASDTSIDPTPAPFAPTIDALGKDRDFVVMREVYRATGGTARKDDLARLLADQRRGDFVSLARLSVTGEVFGFEWQHGFWIPMFQFELRDLSVKPGPRQVVAELARVFDGWTLAVWFAHANSWLQGRRPVDLLDSQLPAVLEAARADRFIAAG